MDFTNEIDDLKHRLDQLKLNEKTGIHERIKKYNEIWKSDDYKSYKEAQDNKNLLLAFEIFKRQSDDDKEYFERCYRHDKHVEEIELVLRK